MMKILVYQPNILCQVINQSAIGMDSNEYLTQYNIIDINN